MAHDLDKLQSHLSYHFTNPTLLKLALTHSSAAADNNERLEFLGDALLGYITANLLFERFPESDEGKLSRLRANLVNRTTLFSIARQLELGEQMLLGKGEAKSGGKQRESILADAVEAIIAAIYLDGGLPPCQAVVEKWMTSRIDDLGDLPHSKDFKTRLQELMQAEGHALPIYRVVAKEGKPHEQRFIVECEISALDKPQQGEGSSKRMAEQEAARMSIAALGISL